MLKIDYKTVIVVALVGAAAVYVAKQTAAAAIEKIGDEISFDNPEGAFNQTAGSVYDATHNDDGSVKFWAAPFWFLDRAAGLPTNGIDFSL